MKTLPLAYVIIIGVTFVLMSCSKSSNTKHNLNVFKYNEFNNINSLDPAFAKDLPSIWACNQLFNGLVQLDDELTIKPDIAKSWTVSENALTYTFNLKSNVFFHKHYAFGKDSTRQVNAQDFVYSLNRLTDDQVASPGRWTMQNIEKFKALNDSTLVIKLKQAFPAFLGLLSMKYCSVVPKEIVDLNGHEFRAHPIGTGPFKFKKWLENTKLVFRKNHNYHEYDKNGKKLPYLEAVSISFLSDKQSEFLQFAQKNIDFISGLDGSYRDELLTSEGQLQHKYANEINMISGQYLNTEYLGLYLDSSIPEIQSELIRKAINYGFDRGKIATFLRNGMVTPANSGFIPKGLPSFNNQKGYVYDPIKAKNLVQQFIQETGIKSPSITISTDSNYVDLCEYIQRELEKLGLNVNVDLLTSSTLRQGKSKGDLSIFRASWIADYPDAENYLSLFYSKNFTPNGANYTHFKNEIYDSLYVKALQEKEQSVRYELYQKMDSILIDKAPVVPLYYDKVCRFSHKNVHGLGINPINLLHLKRVYKTK